MVEDNERKPTNYSKPRSPRGKDTDYLKVSV